MYSVRVHNKCNLQYFRYFLDYRKDMGKQPGKKLGRPPAPTGKAKAELVQLRLSESEKRAFLTAADLSGLSLSSWMRERLRRNAKAELVEAGKPVAFLEGDDAPPPKTRTKI